MKVDGIFGVAFGVMVVLVVADGDEEEEEESGKRSIMQKKLDDMTILITSFGLVCGAGTLVS